MFASHVPDQSPASTIGVKPIKKEVKEDHDAVTTKTILADLGVDQACACLLDIRSVCRSYLIWCSN